MWIADNWKDYEVLDTSSGEKLERWGDYILVRYISATEPYPGAQEAEANLEDAYLCLLKNI